jgi:metallophosphoesterase (TIGR03767 family)
VRLPYRRLEAGPPLKSLVRTDLWSRDVGFESRRTPLAVLGHVTDAHILDAANPARMSFLWQYMDFEEGFPTSGRFRPQDLLTVHVLDATVRTFNALGRGPVSGRPVDCLAVTGDLTNASALSELVPALGVFQGGSVSSHPGGPYEGIQDAGRAPRSLARSVWHPEPAEASVTPDTWKSRYGYPSIPGFLASAVAPLRAEGSAVPWHLGFGNHDEAGRSKGVPVSAGALLADGLRTGDLLPLELPQGMDRTDFWQAAEGGPKNRQTLLAAMPSRRVRGSDSRRLFSRAEFFENLGSSGGTPVSPDAEGKLYYSFPLSEDVIGIMLNSASPEGGTRAVIDGDQATWLESQLRRVSGTFYDKAGNRVRTESADKLVVLFTHHPSLSFDSDAIQPGSDVESLTKKGMLDLIARYPNVVLWLNGHRHKHKITAHKGRSGKGGCWEITTASLIDFPQQSRVIELMDNGDGSLSVLATLLDHSAPDSVRYEGPQTRSSLAALSMELAMNRPGLDRDAVMGGPEDQNVELLLEKPFRQK